MPDFDPALVDHLREDLGERTEATIARALNAVRRLADEWGVRLDGWLPGGTCSLVLTGRQGISEVVLRAPLLPWEIQASLPALLALSGRGGIDVLKADAESGTTLLPRLRPGTNLSGVDEDEAVETFADLVLRLRTAEGSAPSIADYLRHLFTGKYRSTTARMRTDPIALAHRLFATSPSPRLLHGDVHHFNVLRHGDGWIAIDPEGVSGDPAYECAAFLRNPIPQIGDHSDLPALLLRRIRRLSERLGHSPDRIWGWALVRTTTCVDDPDDHPDHPWTRVLWALDALGEEFALDERL